jgi:hypothetical protein
MHPRCGPALAREAPAIAIKLLANLGRELSGRYVARAE